MARRSLPALLSDLLALSAFALLGLASHREPLTLANFVRAGGPFLAGWLLVAFLAGAYRPQALASLRWLALRGVPAWALAWALGMAGRSLWLGRPMPLVFGLVTFAVAGGMVLGGRVLLALALRRRAPGSLPQAPL